MTDTTDKTAPEQRQRRLRGIAGLAYQVAYQISALRAMGESYDDIAGGIWSELEIEQIRAVGDSTFTTAAATLMEVAAAWFSRPADLTTAQWIARVSEIVQRRIPGTGTVLGAYVHERMMADDQELREAERTTTAEDDAPASPTTRMILRLFREAYAASPLPDQAPAIECGVCIVGGLQFEGVLSPTTEGGLRMMAPNPDPRLKRASGEVHMVEHFFDYGDVLVIAVRRVMTVQASSIIAPS